MTFIKGHTKPKGAYSFKKGNQVAKGNKPNKTSFKKGTIPWCKGKKDWTKEYKNAGFQKGNKLFKGRKHKPESIVKISESRIGDKNPNWKGGCVQEPYTSDWTMTFRRSIRERDKYTCRLCGIQQGDITFDVHHIDYDKKNCSPDNLITLCKKCHIKTNFNRKYWEEYFSKRNVG